MIREGCVNGTSVNLMQSTQIIKTKQHSLLKPKIDTLPFTLNGSTNRFARFSVSLFSRVIAYNAEPLKIVLLKTNEPKKHSYRSNFCIDGFSRDKNDYGPKLVK